MKLRVVGRITQLVVAAQDEQVAETGLRDLGQLTRVEPGTVDRRSIDRVTAGRAGDEAIAVAVDREKGGGEDDVGAIEGDDVDL